MSITFQGNFYDRSSHELISDVDNILSVHVINYFLARLDCVPTSAYVYDMFGHWCRPRSIRVTRQIKCDVHLLPHKSSDFSCTAFKYLMMMNGGLCWSIFIISSTQVCILKHGIDQASEHVDLVFILNRLHYIGVMMSTMASQITSLTMVYSTVYSAEDQRKRQSSASVAFVWGIQRWPVNFPHKGPVTRKMFLFDDVIM